MDGLGYIISAWRVLRKRDDVHREERTGEMASGKVIVALWGEHIYKMGASSPLLRSAKGRPRWAKCEFAPPKRLRTGFERPGGKNGATFAVQIVFGGLIWYDTTDGRQTASNSGGAASDLRLTCSYFAHAKSAGLGKVPRLVGD